MHAREAWATGATCTLSPPAIFHAIKQLFLLDQIEFDVDSRQFEVSAPYLSHLERRRVPKSRMDVEHMWNRGMASSARFRNVANAPPQWALQSLSLLPRTSASRVESGLLEGF